MRRPIILVSPCRSTTTYYGSLYDKAVVSIDYNTGYMTRSGAVPVVPDLVRDEETADELMEMADGLFITGGEDIDPGLYGEEVLDCCGAFSDERDLSDTLLIKAAMKHNKPILAICRGCQIANVAFGGTLYQDINSMVENVIVHRYYGERPHGHEGERGHAVKLIEGSPAAELFGTTMINTNTLHHQAVKDLGDKVVPMGYSEDGVLECWYLDEPGYYVRGYQWHPEMYIPDTDQSSKIAREFLDECRKRMK